MTQLRPEDQRTRIEEVGEWKIRITSYRLGAEFVAVVDNVDPGATLARVAAPARAQAEAEAVKRAGSRVARTKTQEV